MCRRCLWRKWEQAREYDDNFSAGTPCGANSLAALQNSSCGYFSPTREKLGEKSQKNKNIDSSDPSRSKDIGVRLMTAEKVFANYDLLHHIIERVLSRMFLQQVR